MKCLTPLVAPSATLNGPLSLPPLVTPASPTLSSIAGGALGAATNYVRITIVETSMGETLASIETSLALAASQLLVVPAPSKPSTANAVGWNVYVGTASGTETKQNSSTLAFGTAWTEPTTGLIAGSALPAFNNSSGDITGGGIYGEFGSLSLVSSATTFVPSSTAGFYFRNAANTISHTVFGDTGALTSGGLHYAPAFIASANVNGLIASYIGGGSTTVGLFTNGTGAGDATLVTTTTGATVAASFWYWNGTIYVKSAQISTAGAFVSGTSSYGATAASINGSLTCSGGTLAAPSGYSALTMVGTQFVFYSPAAAPIALITSTGNLQCSAGTFSGTAFTIVPASASGYTLRNAANTTSPLILTDAGALTILSTATKPGGGAWTATSDDRVKADVTSHTDGLAHILRLRPIGYRYNGRGGTVDDGRYHVGLSAQSTIDIAPRMVSSFQAKLDFADDHLTDIYTVDSSELVYTLVNAVQDLTAEVDALKRLAKRSWWQRLFR